MIKHAISSCSLIAYIVGHFYSKSEGLIVSIEDNGIINYSNNIYISSGSDDGSILAFGFMTFISSFIFSFLNYFKVISNKALKIAYTINYIFFLFIVFLVNLDVSVINSIKLGDFTLLIGILITMVPFLFFITQKAT